jgi:hypothetical protein
MREWGSQRNIIKSRNDNSRLRKEKLDVIPTFPRLRLVRWLSVVELGRSKRGVSYRRLRDLRPIVRKAWFFSSSLNDYFFHECRFKDRTSLARNTYDNVISSTIWHFLRIVLVFSIILSLYRSFSRPPPPLRRVAKSAHAHWVVGNEDHFVTTTPFRNCPHLPTTQCACANFWDFAKQRNGGGGREKDL